ncbi:MAG: glycosyl transferase [Pseudanabaena sp.]|nr:MAG: glycosyl transferase [Pseudanabaena sp.]
MSSNLASVKLAIVASHPIQYYAPLFRLMAQDDCLSIKVFYLWDFGVTDQVDQGFKQSLKWDIPLLDGYDFEFVPNVSKNRGTHHLFGLQNPSLFKQVMAFEPDAILLTVSYNYASIYRLLWQMRGVNIPIIFRGDSHRIFTDSSFKPKIKRWIISAIFKSFDACLYVGKANYEYFQYHGIKSKQLFFAPHAIDNARFMATEETDYQAKEWMQELGIPLGHQVILFAGKFEDKKRPLDLIRAFIDANLESVVLLMVGAGKLEAELRQYVRENNIFSDRIFFAPFQNQSLMPRTYAAGDLFVLPSYGNGETWGLAVNEAMGMGCPVIVSSHVGCGADLVKPFENGLIFEAGNVADLTASFHEAMGDRDRLTRWGAASKKIVANYSYENVIVGLKQALAAVL